MKTCAHDSLYWYCATNENGWKCADCGWQPGEPAGYSPEHDVSHLHTKVWCILNDLHNADLVYVSNGSAGESICHMVTEAMRKREEYDQYAIAEAILNLMGESHTKYWKKIGDGIRAGKDPRDRCHCGKLARCYSGNDMACSFEHIPQREDGRPF